MCPVIFHLYEIKSNKITVIQFNVLVFLIEFEEFVDSPQYDLNITVEHFRIRVAERKNPDTTILQSNYCTERRKL